MRSIEGENNASCERQALARKIRTAEDSTRPSHRQRDVMDVLNYGEESVSVAIEEVESLPFFGFAALAHAS
jgi:predicted transport protein